MLFIFGLFYGAFTSVYSKYSKMHRQKTGFVKWHRLERLKWFYGMKTT